MSQFNIQAWSDQPPIHKAFRTRFFLDTNILVYLIDSTYQSLNDFVELLCESPFVDFISSKFVIFEFVGVRKREHYLRIAAAKSKLTTRGQINFSSLLKFKDDYAIPGVVFENVISDISNEVNAELERIARDFNINFDYGSFHQGQLEPTFALCLASKLSNQDCLVLISSVVPQPKPENTYSDVILLTNDGNFLNYFKTANLASVFAFHSIPSPQILPLKQIRFANAKPIQLTATLDKTILETMIKENLLAQLKDKLSDLYLGKTFKPRSSSISREVICFKLIENCVLPEDVYVTIIGKDLDFIYTVKKKIKAFWCNNVPVTKGYALPLNKTNISFLVKDIDDEGYEKEVEQHILDEIRKEGNLVFIHPDSKV